MYVAARICVAAYLFLTGFGRTASALQRPDAGAFLSLQVPCLRAPRLPRGSRSRPNPLRVPDLVRAQYLIFMTLRLNFLTCLVAWVAPAPCRLSRARAPAPLRCGAHCSFVRRSRGTRGPTTTSRPSSRAPPARTGAALPPARSGFRTYKGRQGFLFLRPRRRARPPGSSARAAAMRAGPRPPGR